MAEAAVARARVCTEQRHPILVFRAEDEGPAPEQLGSDAPQKCATCAEVCKASEMVHFDELHIGPVCPDCADDIECELNEGQGHECCALGCYRCLPDAGGW